MMPRRHRRLLPARVRRQPWPVPAPVAAALACAPAAHAVGPSPPPGAGPLRLAITDLIGTFGRKYPKGRQYLARLDELTRSPGADAAKLDALRREALLANPLLAFGKLLVVKRPARAPSLGLPANFNGNTDLPARASAQAGPQSATRMAVRGGSWYDRPKEATSSFRRSHLPYQQAFDVGFRVVCQD